MQMVPVQCFKCGVWFGIEAEFHKECLRHKHSFHCTNGHSQHYTESEADKLRRERDLLKQQLAQKDDEIQWQREQRKSTERRVIAAKGQITKLKKRASAGVCPCCNRTFSNMAEHMRKQHPTFNPNVVDFEQEVAKLATKK